MNHHYPSSNHLPILPYLIVTVWIWWIMIKQHPASLCAQSCLLVTPWTVAPRLLCPWDSPGKNTGAGCHFLLQESGPRLLCLPHWQGDSLPLCHLGSLRASQCRRNRYEKMGRRRGFVFTNTPFPETSYLSKYQHLLYCQNTKANYIWRTMGYKSKKDRACSINGEWRGGCLQHTIFWTLDCNGLISHCYGLWIICRSRSH